VPSMDAPSDIYAKLELHNRTTAAVPRESALALHDFIKTHDLSRTLEIGFAMGASAALIMAATNSRHVAIDPGATNYWNGHGIKNIEKLGFGERLELIEQRSHDALPQLVREGRKFDFIFIDGDHKYDTVFVDWVLCDQLLEKNGCVVLDDIWMPAVQHVVSFIHTNRRDYAQLPPLVGRMATFQKIGEDARKWDHFAHFCVPSRQAPTSTP